MESHSPGVNAAALRSDAFNDALARLRGVRDALNAVNLELAGALLVEYDRYVRDAFSAVPPALAVSEAESLRHAQSELLEQLRTVQERVERESQQSRRSGAAARAYLGTADG